MGNKRVLDWGLGYWGLSLGKKGILVEYLEIIIDYKYWVLNKRDFDDKGDYELV